jgi:hypothetical protein
MSYIPSCGGPNGPFSFYDEFNPSQIDIGGTILRVEGHRPGVEIADEESQLVEVGVGELVAIRSSFGRGRDEACLAERSEVVGHQRLAEARHPFQVAHGTGRAGEPQHDEQSLRVAEGTQGRRPRRRELFALCEHCWVKVLRHTRIS